MKKLLIVLLLAGFVFCAWAQSKPSFAVDSGNWTWNGRENRLYQNDPEEGLAKVNIPVGRQNGIMLYEFNVRYEGGLDDTHAGFGIHLFLDTPSGRRSWGAGQSYLFWMNWDQRPADSKTPRGLSAQIYRSASAASMSLVGSYNLNQYVGDLTSKILYSQVPVKIQLNSNTGEVRVWSPFASNLYYYTFVDPKLIKKGSSWVALRTNSMSASFGYGLGSGI
jgi:hypothetical protein